MEHGGSSFHHGKPENSISNSKQLQQKEGDSSRNNQEVVQVAAPRQEIRKQNMPLSNVLRIVRRGLPTHSKITDESKSTMVECVNEFISFITSEAKIRCKHDLRITLTAEDLLWAMERLGFHNYADPLNLYLRRYRLNAAAQHGSNIPQQPKIANDNVPPPLPPPSLTPTFPITPNPPYPNPMEMGGSHTNPYQDPMQMGEMHTNQSLDQMQMNIAPNPYPNQMQMGIAPNPSEMGILPNSYSDLLQMGIALNPSEMDILLNSYSDLMQMDIVPNSYSDLMQMGTIAPNPYPDPREISMTPNPYQDPVQMGNAPNPYPDPNEIGGLHRDESGGGDSSRGANVYFDPIAYLNGDKFLSD